MLSPCICLRLANCSFSTFDCTVKSQHVHNAGSCWLCWESSTYVCGYIPITDLSVAHGTGMLCILEKLRWGGEAEEAGSGSLLPLSAQNKLVLAAFAVQQAQEQQHQHPPGRGQNTESLRTVKLWELNRALSGNESSAKNKCLCFLKSFIFDKCFSLAFV